MFERWALLSAEGDFNVRHSRAKAVYTSVKCWVAGLPRPWCSCLSFTQRLLFASPVYPANLIQSVGLTLQRDLSPSSYFSSSLICIFNLIPGDLQIVLVNSSRIATSSAAPSLNWCKKWWCWERYRLLNNHAWTVSSQQCHGHLIYTINFWKTDKHNLPLSNEKLNSYA